MLKTWRLRMAVLLPAILIGCSLTQSKTKEEEIDWQPEKVSGVVVDLRNCARLTTISPRITNEDGNEVFGALDVEYESNQFRGMFGRAETLLGAIHHKRVGDRPYLVQAIGIRVIGQDIIVSKRDARRLRLIKDRTNVFRAGRVVLLIPR